MGPDHQSSWRLCRLIEPLVQLSEATFGWLFRLRLGQTCKQLMQNLQHTDG
jgi:hypothetical protein